MIIKMESKPYEGKTKPTSKVIINHGMVMIIEYNYYLVNGQVYQQAVYKNGSGLK
jgi:hypothetical protein